MSFPAARWPRSLQWMSAFGAAVLFGAFLVARAVPAGLHHRLDRQILLLLPPIGLASALLFVVRGYEIDGSGMRVRRLLWATVVPLDDLVSAWHDPVAMKGSLRLWANGGLFSFSGLFQNASLGRYRAFVTDSRRAVVLQRRRGAVVVSPSDPEGFLRHVAFSFPHVRSRTPQARG